MYRELERYDCIVGAVLAGTAALGAMNLIGAHIGGKYNTKAAKISAKSQERINAENVAAQERINQSQLDFAKNANAYAAADRMNAGLSPLDTSAAQLPNLTAAEQQAPDLSALANNGALYSDAFRNTASGLESMISFGLQARTDDSLIKLNNAKVAESIVDTAKKQADLSEQLATYEIRYAQLEEQLKHLRTDNSSLGERYQAELAKTREEINELRDLQKRANTLLPSQMAVNESQAASNNANTANTLVDTRIKELQEKQLQADLSEALRLGMSPEEFKRRASSTLGQATISTNRFGALVQGKFSDFWNRIKASVSANVSAKEEQKLKQRAYEYWQSFQVDRDGYELPDYKDHDRR